MHIKYAHCALFNDDNSRNWISLYIVGVLEKFTKLLKSFQDIMKSNKRKGNVNWGTF